MAYGSRKPTSNEAASKSLLSHLASLPGYPVPHSWFKHYYITSLSLSTFWGYQIFARGFVFRWLASRVTLDITSSVPVSRIYLLWLLLSIQGGRRLYESVIYTKPSKATMPLSIYLIGIAYYTFLSVAIWIEGAPSLLASPPPTFSTTVNRFANWGPSLRTLLVAPFFVIASGIQRDCHAYLASLPKYTLPVHPIFNDIVCPHYTMECVVYATMAVLGAPKGQAVNKTIVCVLAFVVVNLGLTAKRTKEWAEEKFGREKVQRRWRMVPGVW